MDQKRITDINIKVYNAVDNQVKAMLTEWAKDSGVVKPDILQVDALSCMIAEVYGAAYRAMLAEEDLAHG